MSDKAYELWERARNIFNSTLISQEEKSQAARYFGMITSVSLENNVFTFLTVNSFAADFIKKEYAEKLKSSFILACAEPDLKLEFEADKNSHTTIVAPVNNSTVIQSERRVANSFISTVPLNSEYTFEEFVQGPSNSFALSAAKAVVKDPGIKSFYNPLFIHGGTGLGKTHLMQAIGNELKKKNPSLAVCYLTAEIFLNEYINSLTNGQIQSFRYKYRNVDVLLIDDVQFLHRGKENFQEEFFNTFNYLQQSKKQVVMTSDVAPKNLPAIESRLISRFEGGMVQEVESPSYETRLAILRKKAEGMEISLSNSVLEFIADNVKSHVRAMEGALVKVSVVKSSDPSIPLDNQVLSHILRDVIANEQTIRKITISEIQSAVAKKYSISLSQMLSSERTQTLVTPRQMAMFIARKFTTKTLQEIAVSFDKTHATILHGVKTIKARLSNEVELKKELSEILAVFGCNMNDMID